MSCSQYLNLYILGSNSRVFCDYGMEIFGQHMLQIESKGNNAIIACRHCIQYVGTPAKWTHYVFDCKPALTHGLPDHFL